jgi:hypothetical protein
LSHCRATLQFFQWERPSGRGPLRCGGNRSEDRLEQTAQEGGNAEKQSDLKVRKPELLSDDGPRCLPCPGGKLIKKLDQKEDEDENRNLCCKPASMSEHGSLRTNLLIFQRGGQETPGEARAPHPRHTVLTYGSIRTEPDTVRTVNRPVPEPTVPAST